MPETERADLQYRLVETRAYIFRTVNMASDEGRGPLKEVNDMSKFKLGAIVVTRGVGDLMTAKEEFKLFVAISIMRYAGGDWGSVCTEDATLNEEALEYGERLLGSYEHRSNPDWKIWIITEYDRSVTTILFPSEY